MAKGERELSIISEERGMYAVRSLPVGGEDNEGNIYNVDANRLSCDCRAGQVRRACRHVAYVSNLLTHDEPIAAPPAEISLPAEVVQLPDEGF